MRHVLTAILVLAACADPPLQAESQYVRLHHDGTRTPCNGTLPAIDRFLADLHAELGLAGEPSVVDYYWTDQDLLQDRCARASSGCVQTGSENLYATMLPHTHELVHAAAIPLGEAPSWLAEGLAMTYQGGDDDDLTFGSVDAFALIAIPVNLPSTHYGQAGLWVRHLLDSYGPPAVARFYAELPYLAGPARVADVFERVFGDSLVDVAAEFAERSDGCTLTGMSENLWECGAPTLAWQGDEIVVHRTLDCAQDDAVGPYEGELAALFHTVEIAEPGLYELSFAATLQDDDVTRAGNGLAFASCASTCEVGLYRTMDPGEREVLALRPGLHYLEILGPSTSATQVAFTLRRITSE